MILFKAKRRSPHPAIASLTAALLALWLTACDVVLTAEPTPTLYTIPAPSLSATIDMESGSVTEGTNNALTATPEETVLTGYMPTLIPLTEPGCCMEPFWSADGQQVRFIDRRDDLPVAAIYGADIETGEIEQVSRQVGLYSPDGRYLAYRNQDFFTIVEDLEEGRKHIIPNNGRYVIFSPGSRHVAWSVRSQSGAYSQRQTEVSVANIDGTNARQLAQATGGTIINWLDDDHLLLLARNNQDANRRVLFSLNVENETRRDIVPADRIVDAGIAPGGQWLYYMIAFSPIDARNNGLWVVRRDGSGAQKLPVEGAAQWRDTSRLLVIPLETGVDSHRLLQFDAETGRLTPLTDPNTFAFKVFAGQWEVSPTSKHVTFVSAADQALWVFDLPPLP